MIGFDLNGTEYFYLKNAQGDIVGILDTTGALVVSYTYDAWGKVLSVTGTLASTVGAINPMRYRDYYLDNETGYYYLQSRYYNPEFCRFINSDEPSMLSLSAENICGVNLFAYCQNNPVNFVDPTGYGKTYVIYYNSPEKGFYTQAVNSPYYTRGSKNVYMISVTYVKDFIKAWNDMSGTIDFVYLYLHGGEGVLYFKGASFGFSGKPNFSSLKSKKIRNAVYLLSCKGGAGKEGNNVAWMFAKLTDSKVYACTGSVSYSNIFGKYYARKAWDWGIFKSFYYQRRYIFWGDYVARSLAGQW